MSRNCNYHKQGSSEVMTPNVCAVHGSSPGFRENNPEYGGEGGGCAEDQSADEAMIRSHYYIEGPNPRESVRYVGSSAPGEYAKRRRYAKTRDKIRQCIPITRKTVVSMRHKLNNMQDKLSTTRFNWTSRHRCGQKLLEAARSSVHGEATCADRDRNWEDNNDQARHYQVINSSLENNRTPNPNYWNESNSNCGTGWGNCYDQSGETQKGSNMVLQKLERRKQTWQQLSEESMCARIQKKKQLQQKLNREKLSYMSTPSVITKIRETFIKMKQRNIEEIDDNTDDRRGDETEEEEERSDVSVKRNIKKACKWKLMQRNTENKEGSNFEIIKNINNNNADEIKTYEKNQNKKNHKHHKHYFNSNSDCDKYQQEYYKKDDNGYVIATGEKEVVEKKSSYRKWLNDNVEQRQAEKDRRWLGGSSIRKVQSGQSIGAYKQAYGQRALKCYNVNSMKPNKEFGGRNIWKCYPKKIFEKCFAHNFSQGKRRRSQAEMVIRGSSTGTANLKRKGDSEVKKNSETQVERIVISKKSAHREHKVHEHSERKTCKKCGHEHHNPNHVMHSSKKKGRKSSNAD